MPTDEQDLVAPPLEQKCYEVLFSSIVEGKELLNYDAVIILAQDVPSAIEKARKLKNEENYYVQQVKMICKIDR